MYVIRFYFALIILTTANVLASPSVMALSPSDFSETVIDSATDGIPDSPWGKGYGDLNGDGLVDIIIGAIGNGGLAWYQNPGTISPNWTRRQINTGPHSTDVETGDIDGDGDLDVVAVTDSAIRWYRNGDGTGTTWTATTVANRTMHDLELTDFNSDGRPDIVVRNQGGNGNELYLYMQTSSGTFQESYRSDTPGGEGLLVSDIDADADPDIIWNDVWLENPGTGVNVASWAKHTYTDWGHSDTFIATCDMNNDGRVDIILSPSEWAGGSHRIAYFRAPIDPRTGSWPEIVVAANVETVHHFVGCGDFDRDGDVDIAAAEMQQGADPDEVKIYENQGDHVTFSKVVLSSGGSHSMRVVDLNGDSKLDLFGANWNSAQAVKAWLNQSVDPVLSLDQWTYMAVDTQRTAQKFGLGAADLTGDGYLDIFSGQYFYRNPGGNMANAWSRTTLPSSSFDALLSVDVDNDALGDTIAMNSSGQVYWLEATDSQGSGWIQTLIGSVGAADEGISSQGYLTAQLKSGGKPEIILNVANRLSYFEIPPDPSSGNWPNTIITTVISSEPEGVTVGDIDQDGDLDVASVINGTQVAWWSNPEIGGGAWTQHNLGTLPSEYGDRFGLADFDNDGDLDLAVSVANGSANGVYWFQSPATKTNAWTRHTIIADPTVDTMNSMDVADMDHDGDPDIITAEHRGAQRLFILENNGTGSFTTHTISTGIENHLGARVFDLDGDGDLDIIGIAWDQYQDLHVWRNDAISGGLLPPTPTPSGPTLTPVPIPTLSQTDLIAYWPLDDQSGPTAQDASGNQHPLTLSNTSWTTGQRGGALQFNGTSSHGTASTFSVSGSQLTLAAWVHADSLDSYARILSKASGDAEQDHSFMLGLDDNQSLRARLKTNDVTTTLIADSNVPSGQWVHTALVYNGTTMKLYQNGQEVGSQPKTGSLTLSTDTVYLGSNPTTYYWHGRIDDVAIFSRALTSDQLLGLMESGPSLDSPTDLDGDHDTDFLDFLTLIFNFNTSGLGNFNQLGLVDIFDLNIFLRQL